MARPKTSLIRRPKVAKKPARRNQAPRKIVRKARAAVDETLAKAGNLMTPAAGASVAAGTALGTAIGARIVASGRLTPNQTAAAMVASGAGATYIGYRHEIPIVFGAGIGVSAAGVGLYVNNETIESIVRAKQTSPEQPTRRNARPIRLADPPANDEADEFDDDDAIDEVEPLLDH